MKEIRSAEWYKENLAKAENEWHSIAESHGVDDYCIEDLGFGEWVIITNMKKSEYLDYDDYEIIDDERECRRLTYLDNVINGWRGKLKELEKQVMANART